MKKHSLIIAFISLYSFCLAQDTTNSNNLIYDTIYSPNFHGMKEAFFVQKFSKQENGKWYREVYTIEGKLVAKGNIKLNKKKLIPNSFNFSLSGKWVYFSLNGEITKIRNYGSKMENPEYLTKTIGAKTVQTW